MKTLIVLLIEYDVMLECSWIVKFAIFTLRKMALSGGLKGKEEAQEFASLCSIWLKFGGLEIEDF